MSEYKFACPVCGQHITTDARLRITQMECPTCYRKLNVPPPPATGSNLVLTTTEAVTRSVPLPGADKGPGKSAAPVAAKRSLVTPIVIVTVLGVAGAGVFFFRDKLFKSAQSQPVAPTNSVAKKKVVRPPYVPPANDTNYTLNLADVKIPETSVTGRINGHDFTLERATLSGGSLSFRQGSGKIADLGLTLALAAKQGEDLAGQSFNIEPDVDKAAKLTIRWKDEDDPEKSVTKSYTKGYALRLEFGALNGKRLGGKIYLCAPDKAHSYVAGTFDAEIHKPPAPKQPAAPAPAKPKPKPK